MMGHKHKMIEAWEPEFLWYREHVSFTPRDVKRIHRRHNKAYRRDAKVEVRNEVTRYMA